MIRAAAVIGAGWGDEGKGAVVDALAAASDIPVVIRFNGGAQAGHTVDYGHDDARHVYSHFGAGTGVGSPTFLSKHFVVNPTLFRKEWVELVEKGINKTPRVAIDPDCMITTPYDVMLNRWAEEARGDTRHGSCGIGFGETIQRSESGLGTFMWEAARYADFRSRLRAIAKYYAPARAEELGIGVLNWERLEMLTSRLTAWFEDLEFMMDNTIVVNHPSLAFGDRDFLFEGAQGLLLDQKYGHTFPHVTRSNTGLTNVISLLKEWNITPHGGLDVWYVTRPYSTRHGAGPLDWEGSSTACKIVDATNKHGPWQGAVRIAPLNQPLIASAVRRDQKLGGGGVPITPMVAISHMDALPPDGYARVVSMSDGRLVHTNQLSIAAALGAPLMLEGRGPSRKDWEFIKTPEAACAQ
jgi:adenylosuccinate synthase